MYIIVYFKCTFQHEIVNEMLKHERKVYLMYLKYYMSTNYDFDGKS